MIDIAKGRYWDLPLSLVDGCTPCSPGCRGCWSAGLAHRFGEYTIKCGNEPPRFMGVVKTHPDRLSIPMKRRKPTVFSIWNDWGHETVTHHFRALAVKVACECPRHSILALTKRQDVALDFWNRYEDEVPPANWWSGLTVCNQAEADAKIPVFLQVPGKKFLSLEPLLGPINLHLWDEYLDGDALHITSWRHVDAVILGGETGPGARPMHPDWVRSVRDQCAAAGVPFFFKGWGEWAPDDHMDPNVNRSNERGRPIIKYVVVSVGGEISGKDAATYPVETFTFRVGRKSAGRLLDGRTHDELPWVQALRGVLPAG